jgi:hypothetical protein
LSEQFSGWVTIVDAQGREVFNFDSRFAVLDIGAIGNEGDLRLRGDDGESKIHLDGGPPTTQYHECGRSHGVPV